MSQLSDKAILAMTAANSVEPAVLDEDFAPGWLFVGTAGDVVLVAEMDDDAVTMALPAGWCPLRVKRINSAGTTASNLRICRYRG